MIQQPGGAATVPALLGQVAFGAYRAAVGELTHDGNPIPRWDQLGDRVRGAWSAAAAAVDLAVIEGGLTRWSAYITHNGETRPVSVFCGRSWPPAAGNVAAAARAQFGIKQPGPLGLFTQTGRLLNDAEQITDEGLTLRPVTLEA